MSNLCIPLVLVHSSVEQGCCSFGNNILMWWTPVCSPSLHLTHTHTHRHQETGPFKGIYQYLRPAQGKKGEKKELWGHTRSRHLEVIFKHRLIWPCTLIHTKVTLLRPPFQITRIHTTMINCCCCLFFWYVTIMTDKKGVVPFQSLNTRVFCDILALILLAW